MVIPEELLGNAFASTSEHNLFTKSKMTFKQAEPFVTDLAFEGSLTTVRKDLVRSSVVMRITT
jgi:hypothetical protein